MATHPIPPKTPSFPSLATTGPAAGREGAPRPAAAPKPYGAAPARAPRPAGTLEIQLAQIFARHAMQQQAAPFKMAESPAPPSGKIRGGNLDILA